MPRITEPRPLFDKCPDAGRERRAETFVGVEVRHNNFLGRK
jgi:hypothetical protein